MSSSREVCGGEAAPSGLPELARPRFFPGQLLTDRDLTDLVGWVEARLGLERLRGGWGAVCGLTVTAPPPRPGSPPAVCVAPGYAIDRAGKPVVLRVPEGVALKRVAERAAGLCAPVHADAGTLTVGPFEDVPRGRWAAFDLLLCHELKDAGLTLVASRGGEERCRATRTQEAAKLAWVDVPWDAPAAEGTAAPAKPDDAAWPLCLSIPVGAPKARPRRRSRTTPRSRS